MKEYLVTLSRSICEDFTIEAENEEEALDKANEDFDEMQFRGHELYDDNQTNDVEQLNESE